jgi:antirestriction protein
MYLMTEVPKAKYAIYVACLAAYNNGHLHGAWIDATQEPEEIEAEVQAILARSPIPHAEEWAIHDYNLGGVKISEHEAFATVSAIAKAVGEHGAAFVTYIGHVGTEYAAHDWYATIERFQEAYRGEFPSMADYAEELYTDCCNMREIPEWLLAHIDWASVGRELELGDLWTAETSTGVHVFERN